MIFVCLFSFSESIYYIHYFQKWLCEHTVVEGEEEGRRWEEERWCTREEKGFWMPSPTSPINFPIPFLTFPTSALHFIPPCLPFFSFFSFPLIPPSCLSSSVSFSYLCVCVWPIKWWPFIFNFVFFSFFFIFKKVYLKIKKPTPVHFPWQLMPHVIKERPCNHVPLSHAGWKKKKKEERGKSRDGIPKEEIIKNKKKRLIWKMSHASVLRAMHPSSLL